jgi:hypothetical protein
VQGGYGGQVQEQRQGQGGPGGPVGSVHGRVQGRMGPVGSTQVQGQGQGQGQSQGQGRIGPVGSTQVQGQGQGHGGLLGGPFAYPSQAAIGSSPAYGAPLDNRGLQMDPNRPAPRRTTRAPPGFGPAM